MDVGPDKKQAHSSEFVMIGFKESRRSQNFGTRSKHLISYQDAAQIDGPVRVVPSIEKLALNSKNKKTIKSHTRGLPSNITFPDTKLNSVEGTYVHHHRQPS